MIQVSVLDVRTSTFHKLDQDDRVRFPESAQLVGMALEMPRLVAAY